MKLFDNNVFDRLEVLNVNIHYFGCDNKKTVKRKAEKSLRLCEDFKTLLVGNYRHLKTKF